MRRFISVLSTLIFFALVSSQIHALITIDNLNRGKITSCTFGFIPVYGNQYRILAPNSVDSGHPHRIECSQTNYYGIGNEHDYINTADVNNAGNVLSFIRTYWLAQALTMNLVNDSSVMRFVYDGRDDNAGVNSHGLGGVDFTASLDNVLRLRILSSSAEATLRITFYEDDLNYSFIDLTIPTTNSIYKNMDLFLNDFQNVGTGADFSAVNSIEFEFVNTATSLGTAIYPVSLVTVEPHVSALCDAIGDQCYELHHALGIDNIEVTKQLAASVTVELADDLNGDGDIDSTAVDGDTIRYSATFTNTEDILLATATNLVYSAGFDPTYVSFVAGSVQTDKGTVTTGNTLGDISVEVDIGDLLDGESVTISYEMKANAGFDSTPNVSYTHSGTITSDLWAAYDVNPSVIKFNQFDISTSLVATVKDDGDGDGFSGPGERVTFTANLTNEGPNTSERVFLYFPEIANATLVDASVSSTHGTVLSNSGYVEVRINNFAAADVATITFDMLINEPFFFAQYDSIGDQALLMGQSSQSGSWVDTYNSLSDDPSEAGEQDPTFIVVDAFANNEYASVDNDGDGFPDEWNQGVCDSTNLSALDGCETLSGLTQDLFLNDTDNDGVANDPDNPLADDDGDGVSNGDDDLPFHAEAWKDTDGDLMPDTCFNDCIDSVLTQDDDDDNDGVDDQFDVFTSPAYNYDDSRSASVDTDGDGMPDNWNDGSNGSIICDLSCQELSSLVLDPDIDDDGLNNNNDRFPYNPAAARDTDGDGMPDQWNSSCDQLCQDNSGLTLDPFPNDRDNDGVPDSLDEVPDNPYASVDSDSDGLPDEWLEGSCDDQLPSVDANSCESLSGLVLDDDKDNDGVLDVNDAFLLNRAASIDDDNDGMPDAWNDGSNGSIVCDLICQGYSGLIIDPYLNDTDNDGIPNDPGNPLADDDGDGILNGEDSEPLRDNNPPVVTAPADVTVKATGALMWVSLGTATAIDFKDGNLSAMADDPGPFVVGVHIITWSATDAAGNVGTDTQLLTVEQASSGGGGGGSLGLLTLFSMMALLLTRKRQF